MVVVGTVRKLVTHAPVFEGYAAEQVQLLEQLDRAEDRRAPHAWHLTQQVLNRERARRPFDGLEDGPPWSRRTESNRFEPRCRRLRECHRAMVANGLACAPEIASKADDQVFRNC